MAGKKVFFLDRDGTINVDHVNGYVFKQEDWQWVKGSIEAMKRLQDNGFTLAVITNQSGIGHGLYTEENLRKLHLFMEKELIKEGIMLAHIAYCPHSRDSDCSCRKPNTGMAEEIERNIGTIDYVNSWTVGDKLSDLKFGQNLGMHTGLIRSSYWKEEEIDQKPDFIVDSLLDLTDRIL